MKASRRIVNSRILDEEFGLWYDDTRYYVGEKQVTWQEFYRLWERERTSSRSRAN